ncbi:class I SAM-dependent methyltransferase [Micromonospora sp. LOL_027]|uniref:class I SAM-dependent methyltransferase n=1 Tax=Micromonospora sp. LOL_027 TaxID=3345419 RepID=UPI003A85E5C9
MSRYLADRACRVVGVDLSPGMIAMARRDHRGLHPGGQLLVGFQAGDGTRDVAAMYRRFGHEIALDRHLFTPDQVAAWIEAAGLREVCRLVRRAQGAERDDQAVLLATVR